MTSVCGILNFPREIIFFFGNEGHGVPNSVAIKSDAKVYIPMQGGGRSLNLSISAGIALGEATRQLEKFKS